MHLCGLLGLPASTIGRILHRRGEPALAAADPITGLPILRHHTGIRYERPRPGDLLHVDVRKLDRVPDGGGTYVQLTGAVGATFGYTGQWQRVEHVAPHS
ncbi:hypothetical protein ADL03_06625 [Nocardia sp. NRRL S-836]|nr:hypothetical protein ADL03_06625 [Nocardia sp. NRRL S-836]